MIMNILSQYQSKSSFSKGGLWTVDADYRRSLLAALKRSPFHPYHSYFTPPLSPRYSSGHGCRLRVVPSDDIKAHM